MTDKVLVTGGAGVIGRALVMALAKQGHNVRAIDIQPPPEWMPSEVDYIQADLRNSDPSLISSWRPYTIYHLAATFERSVEEPDFWEANAQHNIRLSHNLLRALGTTPSLRRLVFASSYLVYDPRLYLTACMPETPQPLREEDAVAPRNLCGMAKLLHEHELRMVATQLNLSYVAARIYRVYGRGSRDIISRWIRSAIANEPIHVYGEQSFFDYVLADDVADGLMALAAGDFEGPINLGSGQSIRVSEVVETIRKLFPTLDVRNSSQSLDEYERSQADLSRLIEATGWTPPTKLADGIAALKSYELTIKQNPSATRRVRPARNFGCLITSASRKVPLLSIFRAAFISLNVEGTIWAGDIDSRVPTARLADGFWHMPALDDLTVEDVIAFCVSHGIEVIMPTRDGELAWWANAAEALGAKGILVAVSSSSCIDVCRDKLSFAEACRRLAVPVISTSANVEPSFGNRVVVKERFGSGSIGLALGVDPAEAKKHAATLVAPIYQPFVEGKELSVDVYVRGDGVGLGAVSRRRDLVFAGESQVTTVESHKDLEADCLRLAVALGIRGPAVMQALLRAEDDYELIECNARVGGASTAAMAAGLTSVHWLLAEHLGESPAFRSVHKGLQLSRNADDRFFYPDL